MRRLLLAFLIVAGFVPALSYALDWYTFDGTGTTNKIWYDTLQQACNGYIGFKNVNASSTERNFTYNSDDNFIYCWIDYQELRNGVWYSEQLRATLSTTRQEVCTLPEVWNADQQSCMEPQPLCEAGAAYWVYSVQGTICRNECEAVREISSMQVFPDGATTNSTSTYKLTGQTCQGESDTAESTTDNCIDSAYGETLCLTNADTNTGTFNGDAVDLDNVPSGNCSILPGGSYVCDSTAPTPPIPDTGTPLDPAHPDFQVNNEGNTYNFYSDTIVNGSTGVGVGDAPTATPIDEIQPDGDEYEIQNDVGGYGLGDWSGVDNYVSGLAPQTTVDSIQNKFHLDTGGACVPEQITIQDTTITLDYCDAVAIVKGVLYWFMIGITIIHMWWLWGSALRPGGS